MLNQVLDQLAEAKAILASVSSSSRLDESIASLNEVELSQESENAYINDLEQMLDACACRQDMLCNVSTQTLDGDEALSDTSCHNFSPSNSSFGQSKVSAVMMAARKESDALTSEIERLEREWSEPRDLSTEAESKDSQSQNDAAVVDELIGAMNLLQEKDTLLDQKDQIIGRLENRLEQMLWLQKELETMKGSTAVALRELQESLEAKDKELSEREEANEALSVSLSEAKISLDQILARESEVNTQLAEKDKSVTTLRGELEASSSKLASAESELASVVASFEEKKKSLSSLEAQLNQSTIALSSLESRNIPSVLTALDLQNDTEAGDKTLTAFKSMLASKLEQVSDWEATLSDKLSTAQSDRDKALSESLELVKQVETLTVHAEKLADERVKMEKKCAITQAMLKKAESRASLLEHEEESKVEDLQTELVAKDQQLLKLEDDLSALNSEHTSTQSKLYSTQLELTAVANTRDELMATIVSDKDAYERCHEELLSLLGDTSIELQDLKDSLCEWELRVKSSSERIANLESTVHDRDETIAKAEESAVELCEIISRVKSDNEKQQEEGSRLQKLLVKRDGEVEGLRKELKGAKAQCASLESVVRQRKCDVELNEKTNAQLEQQLSAATSKGEEQRKEIERLNSELAKLQDEAIDLQQTLTRVKLECDEAEAKTKQVEALMKIELEEERARRDGLVADCEAVTVEMNNLRSMYEHKEVERDNLKEEIGVLEAKVDRMKQGKAQWHQQRELFEVQIQELEKAVETIASENERLYEQREGANRAVDSLHGTLAALSTEGTSLRERVLAVEEERATFARSLEEGEIEHRRLEGLLADEQSHSSALSTRIEELSSERDRLMEELHQQSQAGEETKTRVLILEKEKGDIEGRMAVMERENSQLSTRLGEFIRDLEKAHDALFAERESSSNLRMSLEDLSSSTDNLRSKATEFAEIENRVDALKAETESLVKQRAHLESEVWGLKEDLALASARVVETDRVLERARRSISSLEGLRDSLEAQNSQLKEQVERDSRRVSSLEQDVSELETCLQDEKKEKSKLHAQVQSLRKDLNTNDIKVMQGLERERELQANIASLEHRLHHNDWEEERRSRQTTPVTSPVQPHTHRRADTLLLRVSPRASAVRSLWQAEGVSATTEWSELSRAMASFQEKDKAEDGMFRPISAELPSIADGQGDEGTSTPSTTTSVSTGVRDSFPPISSRQTQAASTTEPNNDEGDAANRGSLVTNTLGAVKVEAIRFIGDLLSKKSKVAPVPPPANDNSASNAVQDDEATGLHQILQSPSFLRPQGEGGEGTGEEEQSTSTWGGSSKGWFSKRKTRAA